MRALLTIVGVLSAAALAPAQTERAAQREAEPVDDAAAAGARALREWVADYDRGRLGPRGLLRSGAGAQPAYVEWAVRAGAVSDRDFDRLTHQDVLHKILYVVEQSPSAAQAEALLDLAAARLDSSFLEPASLELRELGHTSLLRSDDHALWFVLLRAAGGERVPLFGEVLAVDKGESALPIGSARRAAALRLLSAKGWPVFRATIEAALADPDPRVRLAAAEALEARPTADVVARAVAACERERHPVVAQAVLRLLHAGLRSAGGELDRATRSAALASARQMLGRAGWRADMELLDLVEQWPERDSIPMLIDALEVAVRTPDALTSAVNERASPILRDRAAGLLRRMTGALVPGDDPAAWRAFWQREGDRVVVPETLGSDAGGATRATFFGVPVTGASVVFAIDSSGSMGEPPVGTRPTADVRGRANTRLRAAKEQLAAAVAAMPAESRYLVVTFDERAHLWTKAPVRPSPGTQRALTELLSRVRSNGGTNLFDALSTALFVGERRYGELPGTVVDEVFLLSDGEPTAGEVRDTELLLRLVRDANKYGKVRINTVFTGTGDGPDLLRRLAAENGGVFVQR